MKQHILMLLFVFSLGSLILSGCQSSDSDGSSNEGSDATYSGVVVDPYIEGAVFCEDVNNNGSCDQEEQVSTASTAAGKFTFSEPMTLNSTIIIKTQGKHNGITYTVDLSRTIDSTSDASDQVVSPLTTLNARGLTANEIAAMLQDAGLTSISASDVMTDPMSGISELTGAATESDVVKLRSSIAVYAFLRILDGSTTLKSLSATELYTGATTSGHKLRDVLQGMISFIKTGLDPASITTLQEQLDAAPVSLPAVSMDDVAKTAVAVADYVASIGYETCNSTSGDDDAKLTAAMAAVLTATANGTNVETWARELGTRNYAARNKDTLMPYKSFLGSQTDLIAGLECAGGIFYINSSGSSACYSE